MMRAAKFEEQDEVDKVVSKEKEMLRIATEMAKEDALENGE